MNVPLSPDLEQRVRALVDRGDFPDAEAVVAQAVGLFLEDETDAEMREIRERIQAADKEIDRGEYLELDELGVAGLAKDVHKRGLAHLAQLRKNSSQ